MRTKLYIFVFLNGYGGFFLILVEPVNTNLFSLKITKLLIISHCYSDDF
jgi:hypothetical protein